VILQKQRKSSSCGRKHPPILGECFELILLSGFVHIQDAVARQMDVLFVKEPIGLIKGSLIYASKIVQFKGVAVVVRSGLTLIGFQPKPQHSST
jgi:hypothetical protein